MGVIAPDAWRMLDERLADHQALLIGPGLSQEKEAVTFVQDFLLGGRAARRERGHIGFLPQTESSRDERKDRPSLPPAVIDADALNALARLVEDAPWPDRQPVPSADSGQALWPLACRPGQAGTGDRRQGNDWSASLPRPCVLTPHPGEMARLCRLSTQEVNADRLGLARGRAAEWEQVVLLKGAYTVVAAPDGRAVILPFANPGLASGGTGDVLAGAIVGLLAQGVAPFAAAVLGGYVHGLAGELARQTLGEAGMVAGDLLPQLPEAMRRLAAS
jgi:NAD(P)H-hydrate epimerase